MQRSLPQVPGPEHCARHLPTTRGLEIGGDFHDLIRVPGAGPAAVVGDAEGHNVAAAGLMGQGAPPSAPSPRSASRPVR
ncbi:hypothetical protein ACIOWI_04405 [Streptomyces sp. NPDC087659]|uniref:hypothetical protein n=1 Tax=Streptomyces sp. NPDC087659 TaxID=3365801 RepID=UPI0037F930A1